MQKHIALILMLGWFAMANSQSQNEKYSEKALLFLTETYYLQSNWSALISLEPEINVSESKEPFMYTRMGFAYFYSNNFIMAEKYFKKGYDLSPNETILYYRYYSIYYQGNTLEANQLKNNMTPALVQQIEKETPVNTLETLVFETGIKNLKETAEGGNLNYISLFSTWNISNNVKLNVGVNYLSQNLTEGNYTQPEFYIAAPYAIGKGWSFTPAIHQVTNNYALNADANNTKQISNYLFYQGTLNKRIDHVYLGINYGQHKDNSTSTSTISKTVLNTNTSQLGFSMAYQCKIGNSLYYFINPNYSILSQTVSNVTTSGNAFSLNNSFYWKKWSFLANYLSKSDIVFAESGGLYYLNAPGKIQSRYSFTAAKYFSSHFQAALTYQKEQQVKTTATLNYNSLFLTLKYQF